MGICKYGTQGFHPSCAPQLGNQEVMFLSRIILPWLLETSRDLSAWQVTHCHTYCRAPTVQLLLISESQLSTHSEYNLGSKCVFRCERPRFPRCSQPLEPAAALQLCCRPTGLGLELETKVIRRFPKISQSQRTPSPSWTLGREEAPDHFFRRTAITSPDCQEFMVWRIFSVVLIFMSPLMDEFTLIEVF